MSGQPGYASQHGYTGQSGYAGQQGHNGRPASGGPLGYPPVPGQPGYGQPVSGQPGYGQPVRPRAEPRARLRHSRGSSPCAAGGSPGSSWRAWSSRSCRRSVAGSSRPTSPRTAPAPTDGHHPQRRAEPRAGLGRRGRRGGPAERRGHHDAGGRGLRRHHDAPTAPSSPTTTSWPGATKLTVTFSTGKTATATVVGTDPAGDIAVIKAQNVSRADRGEVRRQRRAAGRRHRPGRRQPARPAGLGHGGHRQRAAPHDQLGRSRGAKLDRRRDPDRRGDQPGQLRRRAGQPGRRGRRHQHRDPHRRPGQQRQHRRRLRDLREPGPLRRRPAGEGREGQPPVPRCRSSATARTAP